MVGGDRERDILFSVFVGEGEVGRRCPIITGDHCVIVEGVCVDSVEVEMRGAGCS